MSIIFKMLKYLKNYSNLIKGAVIIALVVVIVVQAISFSSHRSSYKEEVSVLQTELDSLRMKNEDLETQKEELGIIRDGLEANLDIVAQELLEKDALIQQLQDEIESLKKTNKALAEAKAGTLKADGN